MESLFPQRTRDVYLIMSGLNATSASAESVHGTNPQFLIEKITRLKIYETGYWKQHCFGLNEETLLEKAVDLKYIGGTYGPLAQPTNFICLVQKLLQLQPEMDIVKEYIEQTDFKYLTALGVFYLRMVGKSADIFSILEPLRSDYRKLRVRKLQGWAIVHMDELVDDLLTQNLVLGMALPHLPMRSMLVNQRRLQPYRSPLQEEYLQGKRKRCEDGKDGGDEFPKTRDKFFSKRKEGKEKRYEIGGDEGEGGGGGEPSGLGEKIEAPEGSVAWWNKRRKILGLKPLNVPE